MVTWIRNLHLHLKIGIFLLNDIRLYFHLALKRYAIGFKAVNLLALPVVTSVLEYDFG